MIDLDALEALAKAAQGNGMTIDDAAAFCDATTPAAILELCAEVRALRERERLLDSVCHYADSVCGMLRQGGWPGKAEALESRLKAVIDFDKEKA